MAFFIVVENNYNHFLIIAHICLVNLCHRPGGGLENGDVSKNIFKTT